MSPGLIIEALELLTYKYTCIFGIVSLWIQPKAKGKITLNLFVFWKISAPNLSTTHLTALIAFSDWEWSLVSTFEKFTQQPEHYWGNCWVRWERSSTSWWALSVLGWHRPFWEIWRKISFIKNFDSIFLQFWAFFRFTKNIVISLMFRLCDTDWKSTSFCARLPRGQDFCIYQNW